MLKPSVGTDSYTYELEFYGLCEDSDVLVARSAN